MMIIKLPAILMGMAFFVASSHSLVLYAQDKQEQDAILHQAYACIKTNPKHKSNIIKAMNEKGWFVGGFNANYCEQALQAGSIMPWPSGTEYLLFTRCGCPADSVAVMRPVKNFDGRVFAAYFCRGAAQAFAPSLQDSEQNPTQCHITQ